MDRLTLLLALLLASPPRARGENAFAAGVGDPIVTVGIAHRVGHVILRPEGDFSVIDQGTGELRRLERGRPYRVEGDAGNRVLLEKHLFSGPMRVLPGKSGEHILIGNRKYGGNIVFRSNDDETLTVIDEIGIEDYLYGVLPKEMSPDWPLEALKAQAVVARTFALTNLGKFSKAGYDLSNDDKSQIYSGIEIESAAVRRAVRETAGEVLYWNGKMLPAYFHSACGGRTSSPELVWGGNAQTPAPLRGVKDKYCRDSPHYQWTAYFRTDDILAALQRHGMNLATLTRLRLGEDGPSGHASTLSLKADGAWVSVAANDLRLWLGPAELKSLRFTRISRESKGYQFEGRGYGHGVGLCQWGARAQAEEGRGYWQILDHYFPDAQVRRIDR